MLLLVVVAIPMMTVYFPVLNKVVPNPQLPVSQEVRGVYDAVEKVPKGKIAVMSIIWSASTDPENRPQTEVMARHMFQKGVPFMLLPFDQQGTTLAYDTVNTIAKEMGKVYGKDWVAIGWRPSGYMDLIIQGMSVDMVGQLKTDRNGTKLSDIPMMKGIKSARNVGLIVEITPSATLPLWIGYMGQPYRVPIAYCPTAVMAPEAYNYLDAHQIVGMLPGLIGATQYEQLLHVQGFATRAKGALSTSHILMMALIVLGNIGYVLSRRGAGR